MGYKVGTSVFIFRYFNVESLKFLWNAEILYVHWEHINFMCFFIPIRVNMTL